jgi:hypothetical protein
MFSSHSDLLTLLPHHFIYLHPVSVKGGTMIRSFSGINTKSAGEISPADFVLSNNSIFPPDDIRTSQFYERHDNNDTITESDLVYCHSPSDRGCNSAVTLQKQLPGVKRGQADQSRLNFRPEILQNLPPSALQGPFSVK